MRGTQSLAKPENLGFLDGMPNVYKYMRNCLYDINGYYETRSEATAAMLSLRSFAGSVLSIGKSTCFNDYLNRLEKNLDKWAYYSLRHSLTMLQRTTSRVEGEHAVVKGRRGVKGLSTKSKPETILSHTAARLSRREGEASARSRTFVTVLTVYVVLYCVCARLTRNLRKFNELSQQQPDSIEHLRVTTH